MKSIRNIKNILLILGISFVSLICLGSIFGASQDSFQFDLKPSQTASGHLTVTNTNNYTLNVVIDKK
ncbi:MAG: hypothetical protein ACXVHY_03335, partial [Methanobacterium sp.]